MERTFYISALQTTGTSTTTQTLTVISIPTVLILGWLVVIGLCILGTTRHDSQLLSYGVMGIGLMTVLSPYTVYLFLALPSGIFPATPLDLTILSLLSGLGGALLATVLLHRRRW